ncbi:MAG: hypothetical protein ACD_46C00216G0001 [uncultured bacterium]|nr:MAG: hypothetical protein ACD_46C00216G0001 [uncultured bacterium]
MMQSIGSLIIDIAGTKLSPEDTDILSHPLVGGVIFFSRNYESRAQLQELTRQIRLTSKQPLLIMIDQEGGRVQRCIKEFTRLPAMAVFGKLYDQSPENACQKARECGWLMAAELLTVGIDLSLAPVLDLNKNLSHVIGDRAFHSMPEIVSQLTQHFIAGMKDAGMAAVGKHFPGHGSVSVDSHVAIPNDTRKMNEIEQEDLLPFVALIRSGIKAIMAAHIVFSAVDELPVSYSRCWLQEILRNKLGFSGAIFSDDLNMEGANVSSSYAHRVAEARAAGCDFALLCNNRQGVIEVLDQLKSNEHQINFEKWSVLQGNFSRIDQPLSHIVRWQEARNFLLSVS